VCYILSNSSAFVKLKVFSGELSYDFKQPAQVKIFQTGTVLDPSQGGVIHKAVARVLSPKVANIGETGHFFVNISAAYKQGTFFSGLSVRRAATAAAAARLRVTNMAVSKKVCAAVSVLLCVTQVGNVNFGGSHAKYFIKAKVTFIICGTFII
jgi:hypothetical protein